MNIVVDGHGGDHAPHEVLKGIYKFLKENPSDGTNIIVTGRKSELLKSYNKLFREFSDRVKIVDTEDIVDMHESPSIAIKRVKSSLMVGLDLVKKGEADAFVSAGNSGAIMAGALLRIGRIRGIHRPALAILMPSFGGINLLIDVGANVDSKPRNILEFAIMGSIYLKSIFGIERPTVGLLSNGEEETKGNRLILESHEVLKNSNLNFIGNIEGNDVLTGRANVVVCDGFVGNVLLKFGEGVVKNLYLLLKKEWRRNPLNFIGLIFLIPLLNRLRKTLDYAEYGGAPLLGIKKTCIISHGRSKARAIKNAIRVAKEFVQNKGIERIEEEIIKFKGDSRDE